MRMPLLRRTALNDRYAGAGDRNRFVLVAMGSGELA